LFIGDIPLEPIRWVALSLVIAVLGALLGVVIIQNELQGFNDLRPMGVVEALSIRNVEFIADDSANVTVQNSSNDDTWIISASVNDTPAILEPNKQPNAIVQSDTTAIFRITLQNQTHFNTGEIYQFKLLTTKGNQWFLNATYNPTT
jgi:hypothetical protein